MTTKYFELSMNMDLNTSQFVDFFKKLVTIKEHRFLDLQKDINYFQNSYLLTVFNYDNNKILEEKRIKSLAQKLGSTKKIISLKNHFNEFIYELFKGYETTIEIIDSDIYLYDINDTNSKFLNTFFKIFIPEIIKSDIDLTHYLNLKRLCLPNVNFQDPYELKRKIYCNRRESNFYEANLFSSDNVERLKKGLNPRFNYRKNTISELFILLKSLLDINNKYNLPSNYIPKILENLNNTNYIETFNYYYYNQICNHKKIENLHYEKFSTLDDAVSYSIDLEIKNTRGYLINFKGMHYICYQNKEKISVEDNLEKNKELVIRKIETLTSKGFNLEQYSLSELINIQIVDKTPLLENSNIIYREKPVPVELIINKGLHIYNLTDNLLNFKDKKYLKFDRDNFYIDRELNIDMIEKLDDHYSIVINFEGTHFSFESDFYIPEKLDEFQQGIIKSIRKGYLITDFGIIRYVTTSELKIEDIKLPIWFKSNNQEEFLLLLNFFKSI